MNLNDLPRDQQRKRIEEILDGELFNADIADLETICHIALRALPGVSWQYDELNGQSWANKPIRMRAYDDGCWEITFKREGTAPTLEAAQAAAEAALLKLVRGTP